MIKLTDLLNGTARDPFTGELYEGLISTVEPNKAVELIEKNAKAIVDEAYVTKEGEIRIHLSLSYPSKQTSDYTTGTLPNAHLSSLLKLINNLGYYITVYSTDYSKVDKYNSTKFRDVIINEEPKDLLLVLSAKYDEEVTKLPATVFHVTNSKYLPKIKQIGLKPTTQSKLASHPERVYLAVDRDSAETIADQMQKFSGYDPVMLTIDTAKLPSSLKFYNDPHFTEQGVYTLGNIPASAIVKTETI